MNQKAHALAEYGAVVLRRARIAAGLSLRELARRARTSHTTLHAYEQALKAPSVTTFLRILEAAGFAVEIEISRRIREADGIERGKELEEVLQLASEFPAKCSKRLTATPLATLLKK